MFHSDEQWVRGMVHRAFVLSDSTSMSERYLPPKDSERCRLAAEGREGHDRLSPSPPLVPHLKQHRLRSNTEKVVEQLRKDKEANKGVKQHNWRVLSRNGEKFPPEHMEEFYPEFFEAETDRKDPSSPREARRSTLSLLLAEGPTVKENPFNQFARFFQINGKALRIFLDMQENKDFPMPISVMPDAKVSDLVGFICWQYTNQMREPKLKPDANCYGLFMADNDGSIETEFSCLERDEPISKFGFKYLGLVELEAERSALLQQAQAASKKYLFYLPDGGSVEFEWTDRSASLADLKQHAFKLAHSSWQDEEETFVGGSTLKLQVERFDQEGEALDEAMSESQLDTHKFFITRANSRRPLLKQDGRRSRQQVPSNRLSTEEEIRLLTNVHTFSDVKVTLPDHQGYKKLSAEVSVDAVQVKIKLKSNNKFPKTVPCDFKTDLLLNAYSSAMGLNDKMKKEESIRLDFCVPPAVTTAADDDDDGRKKPEKARFTKAEGGDDEAAKKQQPYDDFGFVRVWLLLRKRENHSFLLSLFGTLLKYRCSHPGYRDWFAENVLERRRDFQFRAEAIAGNVQQQEPGGVGGDSQEEPNSDPGSPSC